MHYWANVQPVHGLCCYGNVTRTRNVSEYACIYSRYAELSVLLCSSKLTRVTCLLDLLDRMITVGAVARRKSGIDLALSSRRPSGITSKWSQVGHGAGRTGSRLDCSNAVRSAESPTCGLRSTGKRNATLRMTIADQKFAVLKL